MIIEIKLINRFFMKDLDFFYGYRLAEGRPIRPLGGYKKKDAARINIRYINLMKGKNLSEKELNELKKIVMQSWLQYLDLYSGPIESYIYKKFFQCRIYEIQPEKDKSALYITLNIKKGEGNIFL